jgi:hypothetical protein
MVETLNSDYGTNFADAGALFSYMGGDLLKK